MLSVNMIRDLRDVSSNKSNKRSSKNSQWWNKTSEVKPNKVFNLHDVGKARHSYEFVRSMHFRGDLSSIVRVVKACVNI